MKSGHSLVSWIAILAFYFTSSSSASSPPIVSTTPSSSSSSLTKSIKFIKRGGGQVQTTKKKDDSFHQLASLLLPRLQLLLEESSSKKKMNIHEDKIVQALKSLSSAQSTLKRIDGAAHEAYQRTHSSPEKKGEEDELESSSLKDVTGRAARSAARAGCAADALLAAELCELLDYPHLLLLQPNKEEEEEEHGTLDGRKIVYNMTITPPSSSSQSSITPLTLHILVLYEPNYNGEAGIYHGGIDELLRETSSSSAEKRGRYLVIVRDSYSTDFEKTIQCLDEIPTTLELSAGLVANEIASVNGLLWNMAGLVLASIGPVLMSDGADVSGNELKDEKQENEDAVKINDNDKEEKKDQNSLSSSKNKNSTTPLPAIHFVGRSLAGGIAALAASILDGTLPMPDDEFLGFFDTTTADENGSGSSQNKQRKRRRSGSSRHSDSSQRHRKRQTLQKEEDDEGVDMSKDNNKKEEIFQPSIMSGYGRSRSSAVTLGSPPCLSSNVKATYVTSIIHGDDIICRMTQSSLDKLCKRTKKAIGGGVLGRRVGWMSDAVSLTVSSLKSHAHGSEGEEARLSIPGKAYLVRPRRLGGASSMHEVGASGSGSSGGGTREALRAAVLWQLNDVLLSRSMWVHHDLKAYINGLDRVQLRGFVEDGEKDYEE